MFWTFCAHAKTDKFPSDGITLNFWFCFKTILFEEKKEFVLEFRS